MDKTNKKVIFSGIQPSGDLHLGNYLGAISNWVKLQDKYDCIFCVVDYHAITVKQDPKKLGRQVLDVVKSYLASGINPEKSTIFQQSHINAHTELAWILNCIAKISDLNKMTQFKEKSKKNIAGVSVGLYDYPVLMAADILLYQTEAVPVGDDQAQHVELTRTLAQRFNKEYGQVFKLPELIIRKHGARIMGLDDPTKKMSKSAASAANYIALNDTPQSAANKIIKAVTDSGKEIKFDIVKKPAISNLLTIYSLLTNIEIKELEDNYKNKGYSDFKHNLAHIVADFLTNFQKKYNSFTDDEVKEILARSMQKLKPIAEATLKNVKEKMGIL